MPRHDRSPFNLQHAVVVALISICGLFGASDSGNAEENRNLIQEFFAFCEEAPEERANIILRMTDLGWSYADNMTGTFEGSVAIATAELYRRRDEITKNWRTRSTSEGAPLLEEVFEQTHNAWIRSYREEIRKSARDENYRVFGRGTWLVFYSEITWPYAVARLEYTKDVSPTCTYYGPDEKGFEAFTATLPKSQNPQGFNTLDQTWFVKGDAYTTLVKKFHETSFRKFTNGAPEYRPIYAFKLRNEIVDEARAASNGGSE